MDGKKFLELLPQVYNHFGNDHFISIIKELNSNININLLQLLNTAVRCLEEGEVYCEITDNLGISLIARATNLRRDKNRKKCQREGLSSR